MENNNKSNNPYQGYGGQYESPRATMHRVLSDEELRSKGIKINPTSIPQQTDNNSLDIDQELRNIKFLLGDESTTKGSQNKKRKEPMKSQSKATEMQTRSTHGTSSRNFRQKTTVSKKWQRIAVAVGIAGSMAVGGLLAAPLDDAITYISNKYELKSMTTDFEKTVESKYTGKTFTGDKIIDYEGIANRLEADGDFSNEDLLIAVDTMGEVNADRILAAADNPPAPNVQTYMLDHNINSMKDWKKKTITAMGLEAEISEKQAELNSMFGEKSGEHESSYQSTEGYGGK